MPGAVMLGVVLLLLLTAALLPGGAPAHAEDAAASTWPGTEETF